MTTRKTIFFFHFAGGNRYSLKQLYSELYNYNVHPVELPGRGKRINEAFLNSIDEACEDLLAEMKPVIEKTEQYFFFGHSMGALLAYALTKKIIGLGMKTPKALFVSGRGGPVKKYGSEKKWVLPTEEFKDALREMGGCPEAVLENEDLFTFFEPILKSDFKLIDHYTYEKTEKFDIPVIGFYGTEEKTKEDEMLLWREETTAPVRLFKFPGNHFFIFDHYKSISDIMRSVLRNST